MFEGGSQLIPSFRNEYFFLSNFYNAPVYYNGVRYRNNEAAFQAQKTMDLEERVEMSILNPSDAKRIGRHLKLRPDWEKVKEEEMYFICLSKFMFNHDLRQKLIDTWPAELIEGNDWGDRVWGMCRGEGDNKLGHILMDIRGHLIDLYSRGGCYQQRNGSKERGKP
jgi:ribA/ribD-fused uncharacterized protein